ncbi:MAG: hypothetical protein E6K56_00570 [Ignavibacteria bacterium]|nr:MAG: hypothetical protein E6K56_00570 [Ignavibacteria bacterium]
MNNEKQPQKKGVHIMNEKGLTPAVCCTLAFLTAGTILRADIKVTAVKGSVYVRHNVQEQWVSVSPGDLLKPDDSMKSGRKSSATVLIDDKTAVIMPEQAIIDMADLRTLTKEELLLKLAMERIRSVPDKSGDDELSIPRTTTIHGSNMDQHAAAGAVDPEMGTMRMKGTEVLFGNGFYETGILKAKELFRLYPDLSSRINDRLMVAKALEALRLKGEAMEEYIQLGKAQLTDEQRTAVTKRLELLKGER